MIHRYCQTANTFTGSSLFMYDPLKLQDHLMVSISDFGSQCSAVLCLNPAGGGIQLITTVLHFTEPFIIIHPSSQYDFNPCHAE